jgi:hypothetical protein
MEKGVKILIFRLFGKYTQLIIFCNFDMFGAFFSFVSILMGASVSISADFLYQLFNLIAV